MNQAGYKLVDDLFGNAMSDVSAISFTDKGTIFNKDHGMFNVLLFVFFSFAGALFFAIL